MSQPKPANPAPAMITSATRNLSMSVLRPRGQRLDDAERGCGRQDARELEARLREQRPIFGFGALHAAGGGEHVNIAANHERLLRIAGHELRCDLLDDEDGAPRA